MRWMNPIRVALLALPLILTGCLELTGQRISARYDQASDTLTLLLHYDGIHNNKEADQRSAEKKLREFVRDGDVMLFDWFGHVQFAKLRAARDAGDELPEVAALGVALAEHATVQNLGHYRDADGRIGAAQLVVIRRASELLRVANRAIDATIQAHQGAPDEGWVRTLALWRPLAAAGHDWLAFDGHSLVYEFPVDPIEWSRAKLELLRDLSQEEDREGQFPALGQKFFATVLFSMEQRAGHVRFRLGDPDRTMTLRCQWRDSYVPNLETVVKELVPTELDVRLAAHLLDGAEDEAMAEVVAFGPAEESVRAVLHAWGGGDVERSAAAARWLANFAVEWNEAGGFPVAPEPTDDVALAWSQWYRELIAQPTL